LGKYRCEHFLIICISRNGLSQHYQNKNSKYRQEFLPCLHLNRYFPSPMTRGSSGRSPTSPCFRMNCDTMSDVDAAKMSDMNPRPDSSLLKHGNQNCLRIDLSEVPNLYLFKFLPYIKIKTWEPLIVI
jgi:hypothetical protein